MKSLLNLSLILLPVLLVACASAPEDRRPQAIQAADRLEHRVTLKEVQISPREVQEDLQQALRLYQVADDQEGQARCHLKLARLHFRRQELDRARTHLAEAKVIAERIGNRRFQYEGALLQARLSNRREDFEQALALAASPIEKAVALVYLGRAREGYPLIRSHLDQAADASDDYAFVLFHYADVSEDTGAAQTALGLYRQEGDHLGVANTLLLLGRIARNQGLKQQARGYYQRALASARALGDERLIRLAQAGL
jgi:tetratricopeptide (TPR) repeat protein